MTIVILYAEGINADVAEIKDTVKNIQDALLVRKFFVKTVRVNKNNRQKAILTTGDVYFNLVEDENWDLYQKVVAGLYNLGKAQVGHDKLKFTFEINKQVMKTALKKAHIPTPNYEILSENDNNFTRIRKLKFPLIIKPSGDHAGVGISQSSVVIDEKEAFERIKYLFKNHRGKVLAEEFIMGREVTVTIIGNGNQAVVLPCAELKFTNEYINNWSIYSYDAKWAKDSWEYSGIKLICPAKLSRGLIDKINELALKAFKYLKIKDIVRIDMRIDEKNNQVFVVDVNVSPSLSSDADEGTYCSAKALGWSYEDMIEKIVLTTYQRVFGK